MSSSERIDAIVLAGTKGARAFTIDGQSVSKPFLTLGGEPLVRRVVRAVLGARRIEKVYVVGQPEALREAIGPELHEHASRLRIVPEGSGLLDNGYRAFFHHLLPDRNLGEPAGEHLDPEAVAAYRDSHPEARTLPVLAVTSDLPFLTPGDIDRFLDRDPGDAAIVFGLVDYSELERMRAVIGKQAVLDQWKLGGMPFRRISVRMANVFLVRPLLGDPAAYSLLTDLYKHRWLLKQDGSVHWRNWWATSKAMLSYSLRVNGWWKFLRGLVNFVPAMIAASLARLTGRVGKWLSWPFRLFLSKNDVQFIGSTMIGCQGHLVVGKDLGTAIDIDVSESYLSLIKDGEKDYERIARYLREAAGAEEDETDLPSSAPPPATTQESQADQAKE
jgi:hypothetical protein